MPEMARQDANMRKLRNGQLIMARLNRGWSPRQLAQAAGISGNTVLRAERGEYVEPRSQYLMAHALGHEVTELFPLDRQRLATR